MCSCPLEKSETGGSETLNRAECKSKLKQELTAETSNMLDYLWTCVKMSSIFIFFVLFSSFGYLGLYLHSEKSPGNRMKQS